MSLGDIAAISGLLLTAWGVGLTVGYKVQMARNFLRDST